MVRLVLTCLGLALPLGACAPNSQTGSAVKQPALPASAHIVRTADLKFPPVVLPASKKPDAGQRAVVFVDSSNGFLARGGQPFATDNGGTYLPEPGGIARTSDGGDTWTTAWTQPGALLYWIGFQSKAVGFAAGLQFDTSSTTSAMGQPLWLRTTDAGASWTAITLRLPPPIAGAWASLQFVFASPTLGVGVPDPDAQLAGNQAVMIRTTDGGRTWAQVALQDWVPTGGLAFATPSQVFATGYSSLPVGQSTGGQLWASSDGGQSWRAVAGTHVSFVLYAVDFSDRLHGFAAGGQFEKYEERPWRGVLATGDGGRTWSVRYQSPDADRSNPITRLRFIDSTHGWAATGGCTEGQNGPCGGSVMRTGDAGRSWQMTMQATTQLSPTSPTEAWVLDARHDLASGILWHSTDAGASWHGVVRPGALPIDSLVGSPRWLLAHSATGAWTSSDDGQTWVQFNPPILGSGPFVNGPPTIFVESRDLVVVADGTALRVSQNGGRDWTAVTLPTDDATNTAAALAFSDSRNGIAIVGNQLCVKPAPGVPEGSAAVLTTADGGLTWKRQTTLARYTTSLSIAKGLAVITGVAGCGPSAQSIAISRDDGRVWASQNLPFSCSSVAVAAPATIWLTCYSDQIVYLASQDGGQTWTKYQSPGIGATFLATGPAEVWAYGPAGALWHSADTGRHWTSWLPSF